MAEVKKLNFLERAKAKAAYNVKKRIRDQEEERKLKEALNTGGDLDALLDKETQDANKEKKGK